MKRFPYDFCSRDGVWYISGDQGISFSDGSQAEDYLREVLSAAQDRSTDSTTLAAAIKDWPSEYHLSPERANLLRPLCIAPSARVLELGCGCGALTRYLGENTGWVTAVEGNPHRAQLARRRCAGLNNVEIIAANFDEIVFERRYDAVTLVGVLEYADLFWRRDGDPFEGVMRLAWENLVEHGVLIVAIENKLGIKYFSGCAEDHLCRPFVGIEGYPDRRGPRTFGRAELIDLAKRCGFADVKLILPFPDYKLPATLLNAEHASARQCEELNLIDWCRRPFRDYSRADRDYLFCDHLALAAVAASGMLQDYANSFLLIAGKETVRRSIAISPGEWVAKKFNMLRRPEYRTVTTLVLDGNQPVITKERPTSRSPADSAPVRLVIRPRIAPIRRGSSLSMEMLRALRRTGEAERYFVELVGRWLHYLELHAAPDTGRLPPRFLDCTPDNLILSSDGSLHYIDDEWEWHEPVSRDWVIFRGLLGFWLAYRPWIERVIIQGPYRFGDYLDRALRSLPPGLAEDDLPGLAHLEATFQGAVLTSPPVDYAALLTNTYTDAFSPHRAAEMAAALEQAREHIATCHSTIQEKDAPIASLATERSGIQEKVDRLGSEVRRYALKCEYLGAEAGKLRKQLSLQVRKSRELNVLASRLRSAAEPADRIPAAVADLADRAIDVIIPVFNAYDETRACLASVLRHTSPRHRLVAIDDGSSDPRVGAYLAAQAARNPHLELVANPSNLGFLKTVNTAVAGCKHDVIVLNCDTVVTARWVEKMIAAASSDETTGIVCPLSNNATILSVPSMNRNNSLPEGFSIDDFGRLVEEASLRRYPEIPTAVGFCMYLTRRCLDDVGLFDEVFRMGYGEENDLAQRARAKGYKVVVADDTFIYHAGSTSFRSLSGDLDRRKLANERLLGLRWPEYHKTIFSFCVMNPMREVQQRIHDEISRRVAGDKPHVMHVLHSYESRAGVELHTRQLAEGLKDFFRSTVFFPDASVCDTDALTLPAPAGVMQLRYAGRNLASEIRFDGLACSLSSPVVESNFERIVRSSDIRVVHFQHLLTYGTLRLPQIVRDLGVAPVISLHDYFFLCPEYNLVTASKTESCGNLRPDPNRPDCRECLASRFSFESLAPGADRADLIAVYLERRHEAAADALAAADVIIAPSRYVRSKYSQAFGPVIGDKIIVLSHGVAVPHVPSGRKNRSRLHVTFLGNATKIKGFEVFGDAAAKLKRDSVVMQAFGGAERSLAERYRRDVRMRGPYNPQELQGVLQESDVVVVPSVWEETFCLTLSEALAGGVPVIASDIGAIPERVIEGKNGFLFPPGDVDRLVEIIRRLSGSAGLLREMQQYCRDHPPKRIETMLEQYRQVYDDLAGGRVRAISGDVEGLPAP